MNCQCAKPGFCKVFNREQSYRAWQICKGELLSPEACEQYRNNWAMLSNKRLDSEKRGTIQLAQSDQLTLASTYVSPSSLPITTRNLIYHICPLMANDGWAQNIKQLLKRINIFNGKRVIAIVTGETLESPDVVKRQFENIECKFLELPNDSMLRETATFLPLLLSVNNINPEHVTFYGHTKGNSTDDNKLGAVYWRNAAYHHLLDRWTECMEFLEQRAAVGVHQMIWPRGANPPYPTRLEYGQWMFAGTFFWFRHDRVFTHRGWRNIPADRYGAEAWLSGLFEPYACHSMFQLWPLDKYPTPNPYDPTLYKEPINDEP